MKELITFESVTKVLIDDPVDDTVHMPYSAFNQGFDACEKLHLPIDIKPYPLGKDRDWWYMGWQEAKDLENSDGEEHNIS